MSEAVPHESHEGTEFSRVYLSNESILEPSPSSRESSEDTASHIIPLFVTIEPAADQAPAERPKVNYTLLQKLFDSRNSSTPQTRVRDILNYAWETSSEDYPAVPSYLNEFMPDDFSKWIEKNTNRIEKIFSNPNRVEELEYVTKELETQSQFLYNALEINKKSFGRREGKMVVTSARLMLSDARDRFRSSQ